MLKKIEKWLGWNPLDLLAASWKNENKKKILLIWNRGLGDIPLWIYGMVAQIRDVFCEAQITVLTREDLKEGFLLLENIEVIADHTMKRGESFDFSHIKCNYDVVIEKIEPKLWLKWQIGNVIPKLKWNHLTCDLSRFNLPKNKFNIGIHLSSETEQFYNYSKNWGDENFCKLIDSIKKKYDVSFVLFGLEKKKPIENCMDLRGNTTLFEMISIVKNELDIMIAPDSGILNIIYYLDEQFDLDMISLWGNPRVGLLKQNVSSPNKLLRHFALIGKNRNIANIKVENVASYIDYILGEKGDYK